MGGNHEVSQLLMENYNGGFICDDIYFMGYSSVIDIIKDGKVYTVGGISGIYDDNWYREPYKKLPLEDKKIKQAHRVRELEIAKLYSFDGVIDVFLSHDWPRYVWTQGGLPALLKKKPFLKEDIDKHRFMSIGNTHLLYKLKPYPKKLVVVRSPHALPLQGSLDA